MKPRSENHLKRHLTLLAAIGALLAESCWAQVDSATVLKETARRKGLVVMVGESLEDAAKFAKETDFTVLLQSEKVTQEALGKQSDILGKKLFVLNSVPKNVPVPDNSADILIVNSGVKLSEAECMRALTPGGLWYPAKKPKAMAQGSDDWPHWLYGPDNNPVSKDTVVKWPFWTQWVDSPTRGPQPCVTVIANGRMFTATSHFYSYTYGAEALYDPYACRLIARNVFNGVELWQRNLSESNPVARSGMVATADKLYLMEENKVYVLDAETGKELKVIEFSGAPEGKWMALEGDKIYILLGDKDEKVKKPAKLGSVKYVPPPVDAKGEMNWGYGTMIACAETGGKILWTHNEGKLIDGRSIAAKDKKIYFVGWESRAACLDAGTGKVLWSNEAEDLLALVKEPTTSFGHSSLGSARPGMLITDQAILHFVKGKGQLIALSSKDGKLLWSQPSGGVIHHFCEDGKAYMIGKGLKGEIDPMTGKPLSKLPEVGMGCGPVNISPNGIFRRQNMAYDRIRNKEIVDHSSRAGCWQDCFPANGLLISTPYICGCPYSIRGNIIQAPAGEFDFNQKAVESERLEAGAAKKGAVVPTAKDWFTYRANNRRMGSSPVPLTATGKLAWEKKPEGALQTTPPVAVGDKLWYADLNGTVYCASLADGKTLWSYRTGGPILASPTIAQGACFLGSADGFVYSLNAETGALIWRFKAGPIDRYYLAYGKVQSAWPVHSGVLVEEGAAYFAAGFVDREGTYVFSLDAVTGKIKWQNTTSGHLHAEFRKGASAHGTLTATKDAVWLASGNAFSPVGYKKSDGTALPPGYVSSSVYDPVRRGQEIAVLGDYLIHGGTPLYSDQREWLTSGKGDQFGVVGFGTDGAPRFPELILSNVSELPSWDDQSLFTRNSTGRADSFELWGMENTLAFVKEKIGNIPEVRKGGGGKEDEKQKLSSFLDLMEKSKTLYDFPMKTWRVDGQSLVFGSVMTKNSVVVVHCGKDAGFKKASSDYFVSVFDRESGKSNWQLKLTEEPRFGGVAVTSEGYILISFRSGGVALIQ